MAAEAAQKLLELPKVVRELHKEAHKRDEQNTRLMEDKIVWNQAIGKTNKKAINAGGKRRGADLRQSLGSERQIKKSKGKSRKVAIPAENEDDEEELPVQKMKPTAASRAKPKRENLTGHSKIKTGQDEFHDEEMEAKEEDSEV